MALTPHQIKALRYIADNSYEGKSVVNVERGEVGTRTAHALERLGLVTLEAEAGSYVSRIGGFTGYAGGQRAGYQTKHFTNVRASLTPEGQALVASLPAPTSRPKLPRWAALWAAAKKNPASPSARARTTPGFQQIIEDALDAGMTVEPYGSSAFLILGHPDRRVKSTRLAGRYRVAVILWDSGWAQDATVDLSVSRMVRPLRDVRAMLGLRA
jgi:hypothetical protein